MRDDTPGHCDFLDMLEEAVLFKRPVAVQLRDGQRFTAGVHDVVTANGEDYVVFEDGERVPVSDIAQCKPTIDHTHSRY